MSDEPENTSESRQRDERGHWIGTGNPHGRPKRGESMRDVLRQVMKKRDKRQIAEKLRDMAAQGNVKAMALLYDNHDGKALQAHEVTGEGGGAIRLKWDANDEE